ncbi:saccharopine dehydrogenase NADP-binding domain-containing protein [Candidatus Formimonas warabiya]|uniref:Shikimate dehydrogenase n=1 Tax=Formimonas warabiya TaxID=1761012 RepID=A0A3G1KXC2_FORW1|nr:polysaccharide biosynthesis protein [Candidatus Formimonas warabiya]ATW27070.1 shikimate dehydrogenase [Candidatus Formimonas warabiya]
MNEFAFMIHPLDLSDVYRKFPFTKKLPQKLVERVMCFSPPLYVSHVTGIESKYKKTEGYLVACPLTARKMVELPEKYVLSKIIQTGKYAEKLGVKILGLGAMTSVVGDAGITVAKNLSIPVTTGNSYTVFTALEGMKRAAELVGINWSKSEILIIGATGSIGSICARILARDCKFLTLAARDESKLEKLAQRIYYENGIAVRTSTEVKNVLRQADIVLAVSSAVTDVINPQYLKTGAVVCDVARPRSVSQTVARTRDDVLVIEGGLIELPGDVNFNFNFGYPPRLALACMAETILLALENKWENYTLGRDLTIEQVENMGKIAQRHGFRLAGLRSFERPVKEENILRIRSLRMTGSSQAI